MQESVFTYIKSHCEEATRLLCQLAQIPAPSHQEDLRAEFCKNWLIAQGAKDVYIDRAKNVIYPIGVEQGKPLVIFMAHSDVVFPDTTPLPLHITDGKIYCPGVGDDTANAVALLMTAKYIAEHELVPKDYGVLLVINSCEEGLGNLKGSREIMETFASRTAEFFTFDGYAEVLYNHAVGSNRYRIEAITEGGHSFFKFGNQNAIAVLAELICELYKTEVPQGGKTTYNVGTIQGGTSVNTIAQNAEILYEFRSDMRNNIEIMKSNLDSTLLSFAKKGYRFTVTEIGERPCGAPIDKNKIDALTARAKSAVQEHFGFVPDCQSGSTDCNIPLSLGIPAVCVGCVTGGGMHTREEYVNIDSLQPGLCVAFDLILHYFL